MVTSVFASFFCFSRIFRTHWRHGRTVQFSGEWQILSDTVNIRRSDKSRFSQRPPAFGTLVLKQMASALASA
jgi:hypothetical protein